MKISDFFDNTNTNKYKQPKNVAKHVRDIWGGEGEILDENIRQILICFLVQIQTTIKN